jgi:hypothetical protein
MSRIRAIVQDEQGNQLGEALDFSNALLPSPDDTRFICLRFIDPYGDTIFNRMQMPTVIGELRDLKVASDNQERDAIIDRLVELACLCQEEPHLYLRFIGD